MYLRRKTPLSALAPLTCVLLLTIGAATIKLIKDTNLDSHEQLITRSGNQNAGADIYGIGVRVGLYLQGIAFTINALAHETRKGVLLAASSVQVAVLASLSVLVSHRSVSPAEVLIILNILSFTLLPGMLAMISMDGGGQGLAVVLFATAYTWTQTLLTWFWATGYRTLPLLSTSNTAFFYTKVQIDGWFRIFSVVSLFPLWLFTIFLIVLAFILLQRSFEYFGEQDDFEPSELAEALSSYVPVTAGGLLIVTVPLLLAGTEKMIQWNDLSPSTDLSSPGQVIPFVIGIIAVVDALLGVFSHVSS